MISNKIVEYVFFFGFLGLVAYMVWQIIAPLISALALAVIIVVISYPIYEKVVPKMPKQNRSLAALITTFFAMFVILAPIFLITSVVVSEALVIVNNPEQLSFLTSLNEIEILIQKITPSFTVDISKYLNQGAQWFAKPYKPPTRGSRRKTHIQQFYWKS